MKVEFSPQAHADLYDILYWIAADRPVAAQRMVAKLRARARYLRRNPLFGSAAQDCGPGIRATIVLPYVILYDVTDHVRILRVVHGARDYPSLFRDDSAST